MITKPPFPIEFYVFVTIDNICPLIVNSLQQFAQTLVWSRIQQINSDEYSFELRDDDKLLLISKELLTIHPTQFDH